MNSNLDKLFSDGIRCFKESNYLKAITFFSIIIENDPKYDKAWNALAVTYTKLERYIDANTAFNRAIALNPDNTIYKKNFEINNQKISIKEHINTNDKKRKIVSGIYDETKIMIDTILHPPKNSSKKEEIKKPDYYQYFCSKCGNEIQLNQDFCVSCGSKLTKDIIEPRLNNTKSCDS
jgi:tetratricopeptide (TPR) repeat protein